jgi:rhodanese-related sulfurtransferase
MMQKGIKNASALIGGTAAWKGAKYPMESDEKPPEEKKP